MKVKCIRLLNAFDKETELSPWITLGRIYHVMSIIIDEQGTLDYQVINDSQKSDSIAMGYHSSKCFEIISDVIPSNWKAQILKMSSITIRPLAWQESGFLEALYDRDPEAYKIFERERDLIMREDP